jgi:Myb-like DNA-binding domain
LTKNPFTAEEDKVILQGEKDGLTWPAIANQLPGRNSDQVRCRFVNTINPLLMKNVAWTHEEEHILQTAQSELGNKWSVIASLLPGRSENDIKNHWHNRRLKVKRKLKSMAAYTKRDETLTHLRNGIYDQVVPSRSNATEDNETAVSFMDMDTASELE